MDQCKHCTLRGDLAGCVKAECYQHESWFVGELVKALAKTGCHDIFCDTCDRVCNKCPAHIGNIGKETAWK